LEGPGEILDRGDLVEDLADPLAHEPVERLALDPHQVRQRQDLGNPGKGNAVATGDDDFRQERSLLREGHRDARFAEDGTANSKYRTSGTQKQPAGFRHRLFITVRPSTAFRGIIPYPGGRGNPPN